jgi:hypothetical protein
MEVGVPIPVPATVAASGNGVIKEVGAQSPRDGNDASANHVVRGIALTAEGVASSLPLLVGGPAQDLPKFQMPCLTPKNVQTC